MRRVRVATCVCVTVSVYCELLVTITTTDYPPGWPHKHDRGESYVQFWTERMYAAIASPPTPADASAAYRASSSKPRKPPPAVPPPSPPAARAMRAPLMPS